VKLLVTGDAGHIGGVVAATLAATGHDLRAMVADAGRFGVARQ
jgi:uncharacterized protein YbjT (DUF2867 family)